MEDKLKRCSKCNNDKILSDFYKNKKRNAYQSKCKACQYEDLKIWRKNNKDTFSKHKTKYQISVKGKKNSKKYYETHKDKILQKLSSEEIKSQARLNKKQPHRRVVICEYEKKKYYTDVQYNLAKKLRTRLNKLLSIRDSNAVALIGCTYGEYSKHIESLFTPEMTWDEVLSGEIHIDHIKPCASFDLTDVNQQKLCFHYTNLQPLWKTTRIIENVEYIGNLNKGKKTENE